MARSVKRRQGQGLERLSSPPYPKCQHSFTKKGRIAKARERRAPRSTALYRALCDAMLARGARPVGVAVYADRVVLRFGAVSDLVKIPCVTSNTTLHAIAEVCQITALALIDVLIPYTDLTPS